MELTDVDIALPVIKKDVITLIKKIFKFNVHHVRIDQKTLLKKDVSFDTKVSLEYVLQRDALQEDYHILKIIEETLLNFLLKIMHQGSIEKDKALFLQDMHSAIERMMYAAKARKDTEHNTNNLFMSDNIFIKNRLTVIKKQMVSLYILVAKIIDNDDVEKNYDDMLIIIDNIKKNNEEFVQELSEYLLQNTLDQGLLTDLFHLSQAHERSNDALIESLKRIFLQDDQRKYVV